MGIPYTSDINNSYYVFINQYTGVNVGSFNLRGYDYNLVCDGLT